MSGTITVAYLLSGAARAQVKGLCALGRAVDSQVFRHWWAGKSVTKNLGRSWIGGGGPLVPAAILAPNDFVNPPMPDQNGCFNRP